MSRTNGSSMTNRPQGRLWIEGAAWACFASRCCSGSAAVALALLLAPVLDQNTAKRVRLRMERAPGIDRSAPVRSTTAGAPTRSAGACCRRRRTRLHHPHQRHAQRRMLSRPFPHRHRVLSCPLSFLNGLASYCSRQMEGPSMRCITPQFSADDRGATAIEYGLIVAVSVARHRRRRQRRPATASSLWSNNKQRD